MKKVSGLGIIIAFCCVQIYAQEEIVPIEQTSDQTPAVSTERPESIQRSGENAPRISPIQTDTPPLEKFSEEMIEEESPSPLVRTIETTKQLSVSENITLPMQTEINPTTKEKESSLSENDLQNMIVSDQDFSDSTLLPSEVAQANEEQELQKKLSAIFQELLGERFVNLVVNIRYIVKKIPLTKEKSDMEQIQLLGFDDFYWVPVKKKQTLGLVERLDVYRTYTLIVDAPTSSINRKVMNQQIQELVPDSDLDDKDILNLVSITQKIKRTDLIAQIREEILAEQERQKTDLLQQQEPLVEDRSKMPVDEQQEPLVEDVPSMPVDQPEESLVEDVPSIPVDKPQESIVASSDMEQEVALYLLRARTAFFQNDLNQALQEITEALQVDPNSAIAYEMLGSIYYRLNWRGLALKNWEKSLALNPENRRLRSYYNQLKRKL